MTGEAFNALVLTERVLALPTVTAAFAGRIAAGTMPGDLMSRWWTIHEGAVGVAFGDREARLQEELPRPANTGADVDASAEAEWQAQVAAWEVTWWNNFDPTELRRRHALAARKLGRSAFRLYTEEYFDEVARPKSSDTEHAETLAMEELLDLHPADPIAMAKHLYAAGLYRRSKIFGHPSVKSIMARTYPKLVLEYLRTYPAPLPRQPGEKSLPEMSQEFDASDHMLAGIARRGKLYAVVRMFTGKGAREAEFYVPEDVAYIKAGVESIPRKSDEETSVYEVFEELGNEVIGEMALERSGLSAPLRRLPGSGVGRCVLLTDKPALVAAFEYLTTKQPNEKSYADIAAASGKPIGTVRLHATAAERGLAREIHTVGGHKHNYLVFPDEVAARIEERVRGLRTMPPGITRRRRKNKDEQ